MHTFPVLVQTGGRRAPYKLGKLAMWGTCLLSAFEQDDVPIFAPRVLDLVQRFRDHPFLAGRLRCDNLVLYAAGDRLLAVDEDENITAIYPKPSPPPRAAQLVSASSVCSTLVHLSPAGLLDTCCEGSCSSCASARGDSFCGYVLYAQHWHYQ